MVPSVTLSFATPEPSALNVIDKAVPLEPSNPGVGSPPLNFIVPLSLENVGSCTQNLKIELAFEILTTLKSSVGKEIVPSAALMAFPFVSIETVTEIVEPLTYAPLLGEKMNPAAGLACTERTKNAFAINATKNKKIKNFFAISL